MSTSQDSHFNNYVNTISKYVFAKIDEMGQCRGNWQDDPQVQLVFVYRPLISQGIAPFNFEQTKSDKTQYLDSPWVKLTIDRSPKPMVRAAFIWNERQFLLDQALLSGARTDPIKPLLPIDSHVFNKFVDDYEEAVVMAPRREAAAEKAKLAVQVNISKRFKEVKAAAQVNISSRLPADIMWLLDHTALVSDPPTSPGWTMDNVIKQRSETYVNLTKALLDSRFASEQSNRSYQSFLDLKDIFNIDKYRINSLH